MNTTALRQLLSHDAYIKPYFFGVHPVDQLPHHISYPCCLVANTDKSDSPGEHWVCLFIDESGEGDWFDSYGFGPEFYSSTFQRFMAKHCRLYQFSTVQLQDVSTTVCGPYCIYFLYCRARGMSYDEILAQFTQNHIQNDKMVTKFIKHQLKSLPKEGVTVEKTNQIARVHRDNTRHYQKRE